MQETQQHVKEVDSGMMTMSDLTKSTDNINDKKGKRHE
jgi:hypothetical protein